jgi:glycosyltransferase involved in cell wall biosynthesis
MIRRNNGPGILIVYTGYLARGTGVAQHVRQLRRAFERFDFRVYQLTLESIPLPFRLLPHVIKYSIDWVAPPWGYYYRLKFCRHLFRPFINRILRQQSIVGVIFEDVYAAMKVPVPALAVLHALVSDNLQAYHVSEKQIACLRQREAQVFMDCPVPIVTVSHAYRASVLNNLRMHAKIDQDILVIPLGIDVTWFPLHPPRRPARPFRLGFGGYIEARKNPLFLVEVLRRFRQLGDLDFSLTIVGDGPLMAELEHAVANASLSNLVYFAGRVKHEQMPSILQEFHVFLLPSLKESFSYALLEAKLAGAFTMVAADLDVPDEFCDWRLPLDPDVWANKLREIATQCEKDGGLEPPDTALLRQRYSVEVHCRKVLNALGLQPKREL